jgi:hypothetical protein
MYLAVFSVLLAFLIYTNPLFRCFMTGGCSRFSFGDCVVGLAASLGNAMQQPDPTALSAHESHRADIAKYRKAADANLKFFADLMAPVELAECCDLRAVQIPGTRWSVGGPSAMTEAFVVVPKQPFLNASGSPAKRPLGVLYHGGGMVIGRALDDKMALTLACELNAVVVAPNYALAPEHPYPAGIEDSYAALVWAAEHAEELGADLSRTFVGGVSAGGLVTAVVSQLALDRGGPKIKLQFLGNASGFAAGGVVFWLLTPTPGPASALPADDGKQVARVQCARRAAHQDDQLDVADVPCEPV